MPPSGHNPGASGALLVGANTSLPRPLNNGGCSRVVNRFSPQGSGVAPGDKKNVNSERQRLSSGGGGQRYVLEEEEEDSMSEAGIY